MDEQYDGIGTVIATAKNPLLVVVDVDFFQLINHSSSDHFNNGSDRLHRLSPDNLQCMLSTPNVPLQNA
jgi:hypothetical protein